MHEFSTMQQIVDAVLKEAHKYTTNDIKKLTLQIGELTFLGAEQLNFAFNVLKEDTLLNSAKLVIETIKAKVSCECGYVGTVDYGMKEAFHMSYPLLKCPRCDANVEILQGRECLIKSFEMEIEDVPI